MDIFDTRTAQPMLIDKEEPPFDDPDYLFDIKLDGGQALVYLDKNQTDIFNKRGVRVNYKFPELAELHKQIRQRCIIDAEIIVMFGDKPDFDAFRRRIMTAGRTKIKRKADNLPAAVVGYDILYLKDKQITELPLMERKEKLRMNLSESAHYAHCGFVRGNGTGLFDMTGKQGLEGVIAKRMDGVYRMGKKSRDWVKCKHLLDDDYVICGYIRKEHNIVSLVLGQYNELGKMIYKGHVTVGISGADFSLIREQKVMRGHPFAIDPPKNNEGAVWIDPILVCTVKFMDWTETGLMRQPVYKGMRPDKAPEAAVDRSVTREEVTS